MGPQGLELYVLLSTACPLVLTYPQVWLADVNKGLQAYNAIPVNNVLVPIALPTGAATGGLTKYQRVVFGNSRVYVTKANTVVSLSGAGQKSKAPLTCTPNPAAFGSVMVAQTSTVQVTCTANTAITNPKCDITSTGFQCGSATLPASVASGSQFSFSVVSLHILLPNQSEF